MKVMRQSLIMVLAVVVTIGMVQTARADLQNAAFHANGDASSNLGSIRSWEDSLDEVENDFGWHSTGSNVGQWWYVDLGAVIPIHSIKTVARPGYDSRLINCLIEVYESADATGTAVYNNTITLPGGSDETFTLPAGIYGRSVKIHFPGDFGQAINHTEVYVYSENLAQGKPTTMSPHILNGPSTGVDGTRYVDQPNIIHSSAGNGWWQVDLEQVSKIDSVRLWNRYNCCPERLADLNLQILADDGSTVLYDYNVENGALVNPANVLASPKVITVDLHDLQLQGRYLKVSRAANPLQMSEVEVYGTVLVTNRAASHITSTSATANGFVGAGDATTITHLFWGETDHGTNWNSWANTNLVSGAATGEVSVALSGLTLNESYYYRFQSTNVAGIGTDPSSATFRTIPVSDGLVLWMDASTLSLADGASVSTWTDSAAAGQYDLTQGTGSAQPTMVTNGFGGKRSVSFDGGDSLGSGLMQSDWPTADVTIFFVAAADILAQNNQFYRANPDNGGNRFLSHLPHNSSGSIYFDMGNTGNGRLAWGHADVTKDNIWCYRAESGVGQRAYRNGMLVASDGSTASFNPSGLSFLLGESFQGDVGEFIIYNRALSVAERNAVGHYLAEKYNLDAMYHDPDGNGPGTIADLKLWLDADAIQDISHGGDVTTWFDRSGNDNNASQASASSGLLNTNILGGNPVVRFDGANGHYFNFTEITDIRTVFWVLREDPGATHPRFLLGRGSNDSYYDFHRDGAGTKYIWGGSASANVRNGDTYVDGTLVNGLATRAPTNHAIVALQTVGNARADNFVRDRNGINPQRNWDGDLAELLIFNRELTAGEMNTVGYYLEDKYGLSTDYAIVDNGVGATDVAATSATLNGNLLDAGGLSTTVSVFWGASDGGTDAANWANTNTFGAVTEATSFSTAVTSLSSPAAYYYRFYATNSSGDAWATASEVFVTPMSITNGLQLWLNASTLSVRDEGASVPVWEDISGNGHHMAQTDASRQPLVRRTGLNGHPAVEFDGSNDRMFKNGVNISGREIFAVVVSDSNSGFDTVVSRALDALSMRANDGAYVEGNGNDFAAAGGFRQNNVVTLTKTVGQNIIIHNDAGSVKSFPNFMVGDQNQHNRYWDGDIAEIIVFDRALTTEERNEIGFYLQEKYGINGGYPRTSLPDSVDDPTLWYDADSVVGFSHGSTLSTWHDVSGNGNNGSAANTPTYAVNTVGDKPAIQFDGATDSFSLSTILNLGTFEIFAVARSGSDGQLMGLNTGNEQLRVRRSGTTLSAYTGGGPEAISDAMTTGTGNPFIAQYSRAGTSILFRENGSSRGTKSINAATLDVNRIGRNAFSHFSGDLAEVIVYTRTLSDAERSAVGVYLAEKYSINSGYTTETLLKSIGDLELWLDASEINGVSDGGSVSTWYDLSGNSKDATQGTGANQPAFHTNAVGGKAVVRFDGSNDYLDGPGSTITAKTIYMVTKVDPTAVALSGAFAQKATDHWNVRSASGYWNSPHNNNQNGADFSYLGEVSVNGEDWSEHNHQYHIVKQVDADTQSLQYQLSQTLHSRQYKGDIAEVIVYNRELESHEASLIGFYLEDKYGVVSAYGQVDNANGATDISETSATLNGNLSVLSAGLSTDVSVFWGSSDGGTTAGAWENTNTFASVATTTNVSATASDLTSGTVYFYRFYATNSAGEAWADASSAFETMFTSVTNGLTLWLDAGAMASLSDGGTARSWTDLSGSGRHVYQSETARRPTYRTSGMNTKATMDFDGGDDRMQLPFVNLQAREIFAVAVTDVATGWENLLSNASDGHNVRAVNGVYQSSGGDFVQGGELRLNNVVSTTQTSGQNVILHAAATSLKSYATFMVGDNGLHSRYWDGDIAEIIVYDRTLSVEERNAVGDYLAVKYDINAAYTDETVPKDVPGLRLWVAGDNIKGHSDGAGVATWYDLSDDARHMTRNSAAQSPIYKTPIVNGLPAMRFSGNDANYFTFSRISDVRTIFWVMLEDAGSTKTAFLLGDTADHYMHRGGSPAANKYLWNAMHAWRWTRGMTKINGTPVNGTSTQMPTTMSLITAESIVDSTANAFSDDRGISGRTWDGDLAELIIYNRVLTEAEESSVGYYLEEKYGLTTDYHQVDNAGGATDLTLTSATLNGSLNSTDDGAATEIRVYWGATDGGTTAGAWANSLVFPSVTDTGAFATNIIGLTQDSQYYYRSYASNAVAGSVWALETASFKTHFNTVTNGLVFWVSAASIPNISDGQAVTEWDDLSPSDHTAFQLSAGNSPTYVASGIGGEPSVSFDGNDSLRTTELAADWPTGHGTIYVVAQADNTSHNSYLFNTSPLDPNRISSHLPWGDGNNYFDFGDSGTGRLVWSNVNAANVNVWCFRSELGVGQQVYRNDTLVVSDSATTSFTTSGYFFQLGDAYQGDISEVMIYNEAHGAAERNAVSTYLQKKYDVSQGTLFLFK